MAKETDRIKEKIIKILKHNGVVRAGIFGSYARGDYKKGSDIDVLIEVKGRKFSLIDLISLEMQLKKATKRKIDLLTYKGISPYLRDRILREEVKIL